MSGSHPESYFELASHKPAMLIRVVGLGDMHLAPTLEDLIQTGIKQGISQFALDLKDCKGMDSTFMGTLISTHIRTREVNGWLCLVNVSEENRSLLAMLGVWGMVPVRETFPLEDVETERLRPHDVSHEKRLSQVARAHRHLVEIDERNQEKFGPFLQSLQDEMRKEDDARPTPDPETEKKDYRRDSDIIFFGNDPDNSPDNG